MAIYVWLAHHSETKQLPVAGVFRVMQHKFKNHTQIMPCKVHFYFSGYVG